MNCSTCFIELQRDVLEGFGRITWTCPGCGIQVYEEEDEKRYVWVVSHRKRHEGENVIAVFADEPDDHKVLPLASTSRGAWTMTYRDKEEMVWQDEGNAFLHLKKHEVS